MVNALFPLALFLAYVESAFGVDFHLGLTGLDDFLASPVFIFQNPTDDVVFFHYFHTCNLLM